MTKTVELIALKRFRRADGDALNWIEEGQHYEVPEREVEFQLSTGRGRRKPGPPAKSTNTTKEH